jgi:hypothetical protein
MAAKEVIHFPFGAQLSMRLLFPALLPPEPVAESPPQSEESLRYVQAKTALACSSPKSACREPNGKNRGNQSLYAEFYLIRVLQRLEVLCILPEPTLKECEIRLEELRSVLNGRILESMLTREQADQWGSAFSETL